TEGARMASGGRESRRNRPAFIQAAGCAGRALVNTALVLALLLAIAAPGAAAIRFKRTGEATLGGADALAGLPEACESGRKHVWVKVQGRGECIAFYATGDLIAAKQA